MSFNGFVMTTRFFLFFYFLGATGQHPPLTKGKNKPLDSIVKQLP